MSSYTDSSNLADGKGVMFIPVADEKILTTANAPGGSNWTFAIGSKCKDPARALQYIDWCYSPDGMETELNGPKGLTWNIDNGKPVVTAFGANAFANGASAMVPAEFDSIYNDMVKQCNGFGIPKVLDWNKADLAKHAQTVKDELATVK